MGTAAGCSSYADQSQNDCGCSENITTPQLCVAESEPEADDAIALPPLATGTTTEQHLVIGFGLPDGSERFISFSSWQRPLGIDFTTKSPIQVRGVKSAGHGARLGVEEGWIV